MLEKYLIAPLTKENLSGLSLVAKADNYKIADFKNYHSLIPLAQEAQKPVFELTNKDGVIGGHYQYVEGCLKEFKDIAYEIVRRIP